MLSAYVEQGRGEEALDLYKKMAGEERVVLDHITPICVLQACSKAGSLEACEHVHFAVAAAGYDSSSSLVATLIHAYGSCAAMADAAAFFWSVCKPDMMAWNACIGGIGGGGGAGAGAGAGAGDSFHMFEQLNRAGNEPDHVTFVSMISACSHGGLNKPGLECFIAMASSYGLAPDRKHYGCLVDLLGRSGDFERIESMMEAMPLEGDDAFWLSVLGACCAHGNADLASRVFLRHAAAGSKPTHGTSYVLMSNIFAAQNGNPVAMRGGES
jgi:pentatricopeptide repeat protein